MEGGVVRMRLLLAAVGLAQGTAYWLLVRHAPSSQAAAAWWMVGVSVVTTWACIAEFAGTRGHPARLHVAVLALASLFALVTYWVGRQLPAFGMPAGDTLRVWTWAITYWIALYVLMPFVQIFQDSGRFRFPYTVLFRHSWNNFFIAFVAATFTAVFWGLIALWAGLFTLVGIRVFADLFYSRPFIFLATGTVFGAGVGIGRETEHITNTLRRVTFAQFRALMPILVVTALLFLAALPLTGVQPLWNTRHASALLLALIGAVVLFLNAVVQDGEGDPPYSPWLRRAVDAMVLGSTIFCGLLFWAIGLRIGQHGLTPGRFWVVVLACIEALYVAAYAVAVLWRSGRWLGLLHPANVGMALVVAAVALLTHTPVLDPLGWSARNQLGRLLSGAVAADRFDYAALARLGSSGMVILDGLASLEGHPEAETIRRRAAFARMMRPADQKLARVLVDDDLVLIGPAHAPPDLMQTFADVEPGVSAQCKGQRTCALFSVDLVAGGEEEWCLLRANHDQVSCWEHAGSRWNRLFLSRSGPMAPSSPDLLDALRESGAEPIAPPLRDLKIGTAVFHGNR
jgi:hypothetical protein